MDDVVSRVGDAPESADTAGKNWRTVVAFSFAKGLCEERERAEDDYLAISPLEVEDLLKLDRDIPYSPTIQKTARKTALWLPGRLVNRIPRHSSLYVGSTNQLSIWMPKTTPLISIENVVASAGVNQPIDLLEITRLFPDVEYNPQVFPGLVFRLKAPKTSTLIFRTGKMVCTGAKSEEQSFKAVQTVVQKLRKSGIKIQNEPEVKIQNIVASISLGGRVKLEEASLKLPRSLYEPEQFPGLIHRMLEPKTVFLVFASGKLVCTGAKKEEDVYEAVSNLHTLLENEELMVY